MNLVIVESPTKAKTLSKYLGPDYTVEASYGHIRDLPQKKLGVKIDDGYKPEYVMTAKQKEKVGELKKLSDKAEKVYLATDPDREGEAIAWHIKEVLGAKGETQRIVFHEITEKAIKDALEKPGKIDSKLVDAQQARRILDRLVGYKLSPLLWKKIRKGLSAGRVQSVAVELIVNREKEIEAFKPEEYWVVKARVSDSGELVVILTEKGGEKYKIGNQTEAESTERDLDKAEWSVNKIAKRDVTRTPPGPFTTSTLQQAGANRFGWSAKKTMQVAQSLYEEGYITYHRTDSTNLADEAVKAAAEYLKTQYGEAYALSEPRAYKTKSKVAQEAHEAIRPTDVSRSGIDPAQFTNKDQMKLYELVWKRFLACQMAEMKGEETKVTVTSNCETGTVYGWEAKGVVVKFDGWTKLYDEPEENSNGGEAVLPNLTEGEKLKLLELLKEQKFTQPPARYNDASLIKALEEMGIGRPSTYAPIITTIQDRQYVEKTDKRFKPTSLGMAVNEFLMTNFSEIMDFKFTARMEDQLDEIANGESKWQPVIGEFYVPFAKTLEKVTETAQRVKVEVETTGEVCPKCTSAGSVPAGDVVIRLGRFGKFLACSRYPDCDYKATYVNKTGQKCPKCTTGDVIVKKTRSGKTFFGCSNYPTCDFASWTKPVMKAPEGEAKPVAGDEVVK